VIPIGVHASHEQWSPSALLRYVRRAEQVGFTAAMCSDHFHPWSARQGQSGFAWAWLGAALQATALPCGVVTVPGQRYHPTVLAQAAATLAEMFPGRFWLAVGSGEALNEHITGVPWPPKAERNAYLTEAVAVMRALWRGETVNHDGHFRVQDATLYTRPQTPPLLLGAALTADTAEWMGAWADGLLTAGKDPAPVVAAFRRGGGAHKPVVLQTALSYAADEAQALHAAYDQWRCAALESSQLAELATPGDVDTATACARLEQLHDRLRISADISQHIAWLEADIALGVDAIYLHHVGRDLEIFLETFSTQVLPVIRR
jgi:coenzyme F420-dependent glucose-6-phosphate dehydrogenase